MWLVSKRLFDLIFSFLFLILLTPLFLIVALLITWDSSGPVFFRHNRVGQNLKKFNMWKFRTMVDKANLIGPDLTQKSDHRITKFGKFLRRTSIDELPQLLNVLKGDMSIVGPRPEIPEIVETYSKKQNEVLTVKPGITGLSQINGRDDLPFDKKLNFELEYVRKNTFFFDLTIIIKTSPVLLSGKGNRY